MKKILTIILGSLLFASTIEAKTLVAYYSITGNTQKAAEVVAEATGADLYQIELVTPYPPEYRDQVALAKKELADGTLPPI
ncbi:MAG: flavodoxin, partial [Alphaproteobacteria bacterium]|nr:flavodoxin [Alphaproteobacteria bacterium]